MSIDRFIESSPAAELLRTSSALLRQLCCEGINEDAASCSVSQRLLGTLKTLLRLADEHINTVDFHLVATRWLALYTDTSLLISWHLLWIDVNSQADVSTVKAPLEAVRLLDMAIIVAGGQGSGRLRWIHRALSCAQSLITSPVAQSSFDRPAKRYRVSLADYEELSFAKNPVPSLSSPPSIDTYIASRCQQPFVIRGYLRDDQGVFCPALTRWADPRYLLSRVGEGRHVPVEIGTSYDDRAWTQRIVPFRNFLRQAGFFGAQLNEDRADLCAELEGPMYLAQHSLFVQFPELERDMPLPDYVWSAPPAPNNLPGYAPPKTENGVIVNVWIGNGSRSIVSPPHTVSCC